MAWFFHDPLLDGAAQAIFLIVIFAVPLLFVVCGVRWACEDAESRGMSKVVAVILVVLFFPFGWLFWLIMRPKQKEFDFELYKNEARQGRTKPPQN
ncbi:MAG: hypothetical protein ACPG32_01440 [Akkermansiaceae bacterium]